MTSGNEFYRFPPIEQYASYMGSHNKFSEISLSNLLKDAPKLESFVPDTQNWIKYLDFKPSVDYEDDTAIVLTLPFANGMSEHMYVRAMHLQQTVAPDKRLVVLPGSTRAERAYELSPNELQKVADGDLAPIAERQRRLIQHLGLGRVGLVGYSFGGMNTAVLANVVKDDAELFGVGVFEPPNVVERTKKQLSRDFKKGGVSPFIQAVNDSGLPALNESFGLKPNSKKPSLKMIKGFVKFGLDSMIEENKAIQSAMTRDSLQQEVDLLAGADQEVTIVNAGNSLITPTKSLDRYKDKNGVEVITIDGYGHEMGDNVFLHSLLAKVALEAK